MCEVDYEVANNTVANYEQLVSVGALGQFWRASAIIASSEHTFQHFLWRMPLLMTMVLAAGHAAREVTGTRDFLDCSLNNR
jgi:hypothetical protein